LASKNVEEFITHDPPPLSGHFTVLLAYCNSEKKSLAGFGGRKSYIFLFLERLADFSHLAVWVQVFPLALDHLLHPAHQTTAFRPLNPVPGLEAEHVADCRKSVLFIFYFL
jgi:hypothetical protein